MENASKALIIAGAILISILLISVGIIIMNAINEPVQQGASAADSQAIEMFNSKLVSYQGTMKGTSLRSLISTINSINATNPTHRVALTSSVPALATPANIANNSEYTLVVNYHDGTAGEAYDAATILAGPAAVTSEAGYIFEVTVTAVN